MKQRNGKIEFMRFVFCTIIILFHISTHYFDKDYLLFNKISFFRHGCIGVEFFFLVTGYLFAASCQKKKDNEPIGKSTIQFIAHKWFAIFPYHVLAFCLTYIIIVLGESLNIKEAFFRLINALPNFFLIQKTGIYSQNIIGAEWYLSVMLLSLFILYPICKTNYDLFTRVIAPLTGIFLIGYLSKKYNTLSNVSDWGYFFAKCQIRGFAEICLGAFSYEISRFLRKFILPNLWKIILTLIEAGCYLTAIIYTCSTVGARYEAYILYALMIAVCLSFSNQTYGNQLFQNKIVLFLGKISLPLYLAQNFALSFAENYLDSYNIYLQIAGLVLTTIIAAFAIYGGGIGSPKKSKKQKCHYLYSQESGGDGNIPHLILLMT